MKMLKRFNLIVVLVVFVFIFTLALKPVWSMSLRIAQGISIPPNIDDIARATTVLIGPDLSNADNVPHSAGSGVIISREINTASRMTGNTGKQANTSMYIYWVLTNSHVVSDEIADYIIRTADGEYHNEGKKDKPKIDTTALENNPEYVPPSREIYRGQDCEEVGTPGNCPGTDLAVLTFYSDNRYPVAALGNPADITVGQQILVSGWPQASSITDLSRHRFSLISNITEIRQPGEISGNYTLVTRVRGKQGISGGPVFNQYGQVIGIYGAGQNQGEPIGSTENYAIDIGQFIQLQTDSNYTSVFSFSPPILTASTSTEESQAAIAFGRKYAGQLGDNITEAERRNLYVADLLPDDPRIESIKYLDESFGCWNNFEGGKTGGGLLEFRSQFVFDFNPCLDRLSELIAASTADLATQEEVQAFQNKLDDLAVRIARLKSSSSSSLPQTSTVPSSTTPSQSSQPRIAISSIDYNRARNLARQAAEAANGGLGVYRTEYSMHDSERRPDQIDNNGVLTYRITGGPPGYETPSVETIVNVNITNWTITVDYNGPIR